MSNLKDTYAGQWSDDPALLKKLVKALKGSDCIVVAESFKKGQRHVRALYNDDDELERFLRSGTPIKEFLLPAPSVEPAPLEWHHNDDRAEAYASHGDWRFFADSEGDWEVYFKGEVIADGDPAPVDLDTAIAAVHEWRVNHLNSMIKK